MKKSIIVTAFLLSTFCAVFAQNNLQPLATIKINKSETITLGQLKSRVEVYQRQSGVSNFTLEQKKEVLDAMIDEKLVVQKAMKSGVNITDSQLNDYFLNSLSSMVGKQVTEKEFAEIVQTETGKTFDQFMKEQVGMTVSEYKNYLKSQLIAQQYVMQLKQKEMEAVTVADTDIRNFYEMNKSSFVQSDMMKMFLVIVPKGSDAAGAKKRCTTLHDDYKAKKLTTEAIRSQMESTKAFQSGEMYVSKNATAASQLGMDYNSLLQMFSQKVGFISEVQETDVDYQFYAVLEKHDAKMLGLSDLVQPGTSVTVYQYVKDSLIQQKQAALFQTGLEELTKSLRTDANFKMEAKSTKLDKLLTW